MVDARDRDTSIESCEVSVQDRPDKAESRLVIQMICRHGINIEALLMSRTDLYVRRQENIQAYLRSD